MKTFIIITESGRHVIEAAHVVELSFKRFAQNSSTQGLELPLGNNLALRFYNEQKQETHCFVRVKSYSSEETLPAAAKSPCPVAEFMRVELNNTESNVTLAE